MTRREAREWIVRYLFQYSFFDENDDCEKIENFIEYHSLKGKEVEFIKRSVFGILKNREIIDQIIHDNLVNWTQEVKAISYCNVKPRISNSFTGVLVSREKS